MVNFYEINFMKGIVILVKVEKRSCSISWKVWSLVERWMWNWMIWIFLESALQCPSACYVPRLLMGTYYFFSYHSDYQCGMTSKLRFQPYSRVANNCTPQLLLLPPNMLFPPRTSLFQTPLLLIFSHFCSIFECK